MQQKINLNIGMEHILKGSVFFLSFILSGCASLQYKQGYQISYVEHRNDKKDGVIEFPRRFGRNDVLHIKEPRINIEIGKKPKTSILSFGPGLILPLPIFPWIPGIVSAFKNRISESESLSVVITFLEDESKNGPVGYRVNPLAIILTTSKGETFRPVSFGIDLYYFDGIYNKRRKENDPAFYTRDGGDLSFTIKPSPHRSEVVLTLDFAIPFGGLDEAILVIDSLSVDGNPIKLERSIITNRKRFKLWWAYTFNT